MCYRPRDSRQEIELQKSHGRTKWYCRAKRIIAFGGWAFSTEPATYSFFRNAVKPETRETFATACVSFDTTHGLDGVDFD
jgi:GH18 family chitinase